MFKKIYFSENSYKIYEPANGRYVDMTYPLYLDFIGGGGSPVIEIDPSVQNILEIVGGVVQPKADAGATLLAAAKATAKETVYQNRKARETAGFSFGGTTIATDAESQAILSNAYIAAKNGLLESGTLWKDADGNFTTLTKEQIIAIYEAVVAFIKQGFELEKAKHDLINAAETVEAVNAIDLAL